MAVTSPGSFFAFSCRRAVASHSRAVRSAEPENSSWRRIEPSAGDGANATAVTLRSAESHAGVAPTGSCKVAKPQWQAVSG